MWYNIVKGIQKGIQIEMKVIKVKEGSNLREVNWIVEFDSINELVRYLKETPTNDLFKNRYGLDSKSTGKIAENFTGTKTLDEAFELLSGGWKVEAIKLNKAFQVTKKDLGAEQQLKSVLDIVGFQPVVPLYLSGCPTNMVNRKSVNIKSKVITINYLKCMSAFVDKDEQYQESMKCLQLIRAIEEKGYRINLNMVICSGEVALKVRLKSANERLNISKLAFPMLHASMIRRIFLRFVEVCPYYKSKEITRGYGFVLESRKIEKALEKARTIGSKDVILDTLLGAVGASENDNGTRIDEIALEKYLKNL